jgi:hypothetical protein
MNNCAISPGQPTSQSQSQKQRKAREAEVKVEPAARGSVGLVCMTVETLDTLKQSKVLVLPGPQDLQI